MSRGKAKFWGPEEHKTEGRSGSHVKKMKNYKYQIPIFKSKYLLRMRKEDAKRADFKGRNRFIH